MNCENARELVSPYLDGELAIESSLAIERHLSECAACAALYNRRRALSAVLSESGLYERCPPDTSAEIQAALRQSPPDRYVPRTSGFRRYAAAAVLLVAALAAMGLVKSRVDRGHGEMLLAQQVVSSHVHSLLGDHVIDVASSDQHVVKPWFAGKLDFAPAVPERTEQGFELVGGRWEYINNHQAAAIVYRLRGHVINVFVWRRTPADSPAEGSGALEGHQYVHWVADGLTYWVVSDLNLAELEQFAAKVRRAPQPTHGDSSKIIAPAEQSNDENSSQ